MGDSLCSPRAISSGEDSPLAAFDSIIETMMPATTVSGARAAPSPVFPMLSINNILGFGGSNCTAGDYAGTLASKLVEKDREIAALRRQVQDAIASRLKLEKVVKARDAKIGSLERSAETATRKSAGMTAQLNLARAELDRTKHRAVTSHRQQEQRIASLEQTITRKMGLSRPGAFAQQDLLINPLTGKPVDNVACSTVCRAVLQATANVQQTHDSQVHESQRLEALCEVLERAFKLDVHRAIVPQGILQRLEVDVECAAELLDVLVQHIEDADDREGGTDQDLGSSDVCHHYDLVGKAQDENCKLKDSHNVRLSAPSLEAGCVIADDQAAANSLLEFF